MPIIDDAELPIVPLRFVKIIGPGVDAIENRKECGSPAEITTEELRRSLDKVKDRNFKGLKMLANAPIRTR